MELIKAIEERRTIHKFNSKKVPEAYIDRSIQAANFAPCHRLTFPWRFYKVNQTTRESLAKIAIDIKLNSDIYDQKSAEKIRLKIMTPSHLVVVSQISSDNTKTKLEDYAACACAIQNLCLSLVDQGVGSKWSTGKLISSWETYKLLKINPSIEDIIGFIWIGYGEIPATLNRPNIHDIYSVR